MKKSILIGLLGVFSIGLANATPLSPEEALQRISGVKVKGLKGANKHAKDLVCTINDVQSQPVMYVFSGNDGYMILAADDVAIPLLGYADEGVFDEDNMPPQMKWWLSEYNRQISDARKKNVRSASTNVGIDPAWTEIQPMIKTKWDQDTPYNDECPVSNSKKTYTGCVATAMSQVMNYWKYPAKGTGRISYRPEKLNKLLGLNFDNQVFDWGSMLDEYEKCKYTEKEADAVALLMKCAGYGVQMNYGTDASGTQSYRIPTALKNYFSYDKNCRIVNREPYSVSEWNKMVYENLKNVGPIIYNGQSIYEGGHSFVCDGYDGNGYFHFNWGWSGMSDGYFTLNALDPSALGIGGGGGGFNFSQDVILGIQPPNDEPEIIQEAYLYQNAYLTASISGLTVTFGLGGPEYPIWMSYNFYPVEMKFGAICEPIDGTEGETQYFTSSFQSITYQEYGMGIYQKSPSGRELNPTVALRNIKEGKYKLTLATKDLMDPGAEWVPVRTPYGYANYVYLIREGSKYTIENVAPSTFTCDSFSLDTPLYYNCMASFNVSLKNETELDLTQGVMPVIYIDGKPAFVGKSFLLVIPAKSSVDTSLLTGFDPLQGVPAISSDTPVQIILTDPSIDTVYDGAVIDATMKRNPGNPSMSMMSINIDGEKDGDVTEIKDKSHIVVSASVRVNRGYFAYPLYALVLDEQGYVLHSQEIGGAVTIMNSGETKDFQQVVDFPTAEIGMTYPLYIAYKKDYRYTSIGIPAYFRVTENSGVSEINIQANNNFRIEKSNGLLIVTSNDEFENIAVSDIEGLPVGSISKEGENKVVIRLDEHYRGVIILKASNSRGEYITKKVIM